MTLVKAGLLTLMCSLFSMPAWSDTLQPFVSAGVDREDNLFRLPEGQIRDVSEGADTARTVSGGMRFALPFSRQLLTGIAEVGSVKFEHNKQLDHTRKNLRADWHWFVAAHFEGHVGARHVQELASFADFDSTERNLRTNKRQYADGSWRFHPSWRWHAGYIRDEYAYDLPSRFTSGRKEDAVTTGVDYLARSGSTIGLQLRRLDGDYPNRVAPVNEDFFFSGYVQNEAKVNVLWLATGKTQILFLGGWVQRKQKSAAGRVKSGANARLIANWAPTGKLKLTGQAWREFSAIDGALIDSALNDGASAGLTWDFSEEIQGVVDLKHVDRTFSPYGGPGAQNPLVSSSDVSKTHTVGLIYKPLRSITLKATAFRDERAGSVAAGTRSFKANGAAFSATLEFH